MSHTKWDIYYWMKAQLDDEGKLPSESEIFERYNRLNYDKEIIKDGIRMYHEINN